MRVTTLVYLLNDRGEVLLARKKRGLGMGKWNGPGGKLHMGETPEQAAIRETQEEVGVIPRNLFFSGKIDFIGPEHLASECFVYTAHAWEGEITESEEMEPRWFPVDALPLEEMWEDDRFWMNDVLKGKRVHWRFTFNESEQMIARERMEESI